MLHIFLKCGKFPPVGHFIQILTLATFFDCFEKRKKKEFLNMANGESGNFFTHILMGCYPLRENLILTPSSDSYMSQPKIFDKDGGRM